jgi:hypothetical protein
MYYNITTITCAEKGNGQIFLLGASSMGNVRGYFGKATRLRAAVSGTNLLVFVPDVRGSTLWDVEIFCQHL